MDKDRKAYLKSYRKQYKNETHRVNLTLNNSEFHQFTKAAHGEKITPFIKKMALAGLNNQVAIPQHINEELKTLRFAILNIANNVNQIAHHSNRIKDLSSRDEHNLLQHLKQLNDVVKAYTENSLSPKQHDH
ncbi:MAG: hypothetical protein ISR69_13885 [Gammaproteobacteria bacterium]|nr:hypothetical protein [Gammaproteobacteria bacterium]